MIYIYYNDICTSTIYFLDRGWTPEGPKEDSNEIALPAPNDN